jgi:transcriptional regulator with XRE-family HTH domain
MISQPSLGIILREQRDHSKQTLRAVSRRAKISHSHLEKIESGKVEPTVATLLRLLEASDAPNNLVLEIFGVTDSTKFNDDRLAKAMVAQMFMEAGIAFEEPPPRKGNVDFILHLGPGRFVLIEVKASPYKTAIKTQS